MEFPVEIDPRRALLEGDFPDRGLTPRQAASRRHAVGVQGLLVAPRRLLQPPLPLQGPRQKEQGPRTPLLRIISGQALQARGQGFGGPDVLALEAEKPPVDHFPPRQGQGQARRRLPAVEGGAGQDQGNSPVRAAPGHAAEVLLKARVDGLGPVRKVLRGARRRRRAMEKILEELEAGRPILGVHEP